MTTRLTSSRLRAPTSSRPLSSRKGAGFSSGGIQTSGGKGVITPLEKVADSFSQFLKDTKDAPENKIKQFKKEISLSIQKASENLKNDQYDPETSLKFAKEADLKFKEMNDFITSQTLEEPELKTFKFSVLLQLADSFKAHSNFDDAVFHYEKVVKDRDFQYPFIVYLELGNLFFKQQKYSEAVKRYEAGINHLKADANRLKARFHHCCGVSLIRMGQFHQALSHFSSAMKFDLNIKSGFNLVLCHSILSPVDELRESFKRMLTVKPSTTITDLSESDILGNQLHVERREQLRLIMLAARLVSQKSKDNWEEGYEFVLKLLKTSKFPEASGEFEISYSLAHLNHRNAEKAIDMLRQIRKKN